MHGLRVVILSERRPRHLGVRTAHVVNAFGAVSADAVINNDATRYG